MPPRHPRILSKSEWELRHDPANWPDWLKACQSENLEAEVIDGRIIIWGGTIHDGVIYDCDMLGGVVREAIWVKGNFLTGRWMNGDWRDGFIGQSVIWADGIHRAGEFNGLWLGGLWIGGKWNGWWEKTGRCPGSNILEVKR